MSRTIPKDETQAVALADAQGGIDVPGETSRASRHVPIKRRSTLKRLSLLSWRSKPSNSLATNLPNEILLLIFKNVQRLRLDPSRVGPRPRDDVRLFPLVCKGWYGAATRVFYEVVEFSRVASVFKFHRSLKERPHLRGLVKSLYLPARVHKDCPPHLSKVFTQIIHLTESLEELHTMCFVLSDEVFQHQTPSAPARYVIPVQSDRHPDMRELTLYADNYTWCLFPSILTSSFPKLESLSLHGFYIMHEFSPDTIPILPCLTSISWTYGSGFNCLDRWLQACPKLHRVYLKSTPILSAESEIPPLGIFRDNRITHLELRNMYGYDVAYEPYIWLASCTNIQELHISWDLFRAHDSYLPPSLETLTIQVSVYNDPSMELIEGFLRKCLSLQHFGLRICNHNKWFVRNKRNLEQLFEASHVKLYVDYITCWCQPIVAQVAADVFFPVVKWGWDQCRRLTKQQTKETIEWEWPHMR